MASKITLAFLITVTVALLGASYFLLKQEPSTEGFQTQPYTVNDLDINLCPSYATEIQTAKGSTDCCQGDMIDGKCNGTTFCTKSPAYPGVKACVDKWREYFKDKGVNMCPPTMPNYFENIQNKNAIKGCSAGPIVADGSVPKDSTARQCKIYVSEADNLRKADSCYVEKLRSRIQCPVVNSNSPSPNLQRLSWKDNSLLAFFTCNYPFEPNMPIVCYDRATVEAFWDNEAPNWRTNSAYSEWLKVNACDNFVRTRENSRREAERLEAERRAREAAEQARRQEEERRKRAEEEARRQAEEARRLQQQLEEARRKSQGAVKFAWYGAGYRTRGAEVTSQVRNAMNAGSIAVNNNTFGDTAPGVYKQLFVDFTPANSDTTKRVTVGEGGTLGLMA
jgi:hypothetical protein